MSHFFGEQKNDSSPAAEAASKSNANINNIENIIAL